MTVGDRIKYARKKIGITQTELGEKIGVTGVAIMRYEKGTRNPDVATLNKLADAMSVSPAYLMGSLDYDHAVVIDELTEGQKRAAFRTELMKNKIHAAVFGIVKSYVLHSLPPDYNLEADGLDKTTGELRTLSIVKVTSCGHQIAPGVHGMGEIETETVKEIGSSEYDQIVDQISDFAEYIVDKHILAGIE